MLIKIRICGSAWHGSQWCVRISLFMFDFISQSFTAFTCEVLVEHLKRYSISTCTHSNVLSSIYHQVLCSQQTYLNCFSVTNTLSLSCMPRNHFSPQHYPVSPVKSMDMNICFQLYLINTNPGFKANKGINISITK